MKLERKEIRNGIKNLMENPTGNSENDWKSMLWYLEDYKQIVKDGQRDALRVQEESLHKKNLEIRKKSKRIEMLQKIVTDAMTRGFLTKKQRDEVRKDSIKESK